MSFKFYFLGYPFLVKLHLGCGSRFIPGYVHIDAVPFEHLDHVASIDQLDFIESDSVDVIYSCHVLEHFRRRDLPRVLKEWVRVLKSGGILRISVPDFESIVKIYSQTENLDDVVGPLFGRQNYLYNFHYNVFDFNSLSRNLEDCGLGKVARYDWRTTEHSGVDDYSQAYFPHMEKESGIQLSLNVEARKP
jgi:predicted SAM-dependent methyltransferase